MTPFDHPFYKMPVWLVSSILAVVTGLIAFATSYGVVTSQVTTVRANQAVHSSDETRHVNAELVNWRLQQIDNRLTEVLTMMQEDRQTKNNDGS